MRITYFNEDFPAGSIPNGSHELILTWSEIIWAALTIGRPSTHFTAGAGAPAASEAMFRISLIHMALEQFGPSAVRLRRTETYKNLDPTEKGAISYFLGMTFCKLFASRLLDTPWLLHLDVYKDAFSVASLGRSRPDLFGQQIGTGAWLAFEAKGRATKPSVADRAKAKAQAARIVSVGGVAPAMRVGSFTHFASDVLQFRWIDPPADSKRPINLPEVADRWRYYYEPIRSLWAGDTDERSASKGELVIDLPELDIKIRIHGLLAPTIVMRAWSRARERAEQHRGRIVADGFQPDGIKVECGPRWSQRRSTRKEA